MASPEAASEPASPPALRASSDAPSTWLARAWDRRRRLIPGLTLATVVAIAAGALSARYEAPAMLFALLLGVALSFLSEDKAARPGLEFAASALLKAAIAVLGLTIPLSAIAEIGAVPLLSVVAMSLGVILLGFFIGRRLGWTPETALVGAGAVAICGASAALALAAIASTERHPRARTMAIIVCVTGLSSIAMVLYPVLLDMLELSEAQAGFVIGASIHDVAQVVGAGYSISQEAGETATLTKMVRVAMLPVALLLAIAILARGGASRSAAGKIRLPWFVAAFSVGVLIASLVPIPQGATEAISQVSRSAFFISIAAIGLLSKGREILSAGSDTLKFLALLSLVLFISSLGVAQLLDATAR